MYECHFDNMEVKQYHKSQINENFKEIINSSYTKNTNTLLLSMKRNAVYSYIYCKITTILGDDFPCILSEMRSRMEMNDTRCYNESDFKFYHILLVENFNSINTSKEQLIEIFALSDIKVLFIDDLIG